MIPCSYSYDTATWDTQEREFNLLLKVFYSFETALTSAQWGV